MSTTRIGIVGCGNIAGAYAEGVPAFEGLELVGVTDLDRERAQALAERVGCRVYDDLDAMLADPGIDVVVNLTIHHAHYDVTRACLEAGRHVYSEKPLAMSHDEARALVELAERRGVRLGCSPFAFIGEGQQTALSVLRSGRLGTVRLIYAEVNWGRIESWHPDPDAFYDVGPLADVGVYPLSLLTAFLGPVRRVRAFGDTLLPERTTTSGRSFRVGSPDLVVAMLELASGPQVRLTCNFYVDHGNKQGSGIAFHGDAASLYMSAWMEPDIVVEVADFGGPLERVPLLRPAPAAINWARGVAELAQALREDRPHRASGAHAAHVVEVLDATRRAIEEGGAVEVRSSFPPPAPMPWSDASDAPA